MAAVAVEKFESRRISTGQDPFAELEFFIKGTNDNVEARNALLLVAPSVFDPWGTGITFLPRADVSIEPTGDNLWDGFVTYSINAPETSDSSYTFETGGGSQHITQSQLTGKYAKSGEDAPDFKSAIGVTKDSVEGVDIVVPVFQFSETHYIANSAVTAAYIAKLFARTGQVNADVFKGFAAFQVLFLGASGSKRGQGDWEITFKFAASPNRSDFTIGEIEHIEKGGWEYLWVRYADEVDGTANAIVKRPVAVYVEKVYDLGDFADLGIGV